MSKLTNEQKYKTADERVKAFAEWCSSKSCENCVLSNVPRYHTVVGCKFLWLALEAEEEKPEPCPFCGKIPYVNEGTNGYGDRLYYIVCECGYSTKENFRNKEYAIAAHNRVARAVIAAKESEVK